MNNNNNDYVRHRNNSMGWANDGSSLPNDPRSENNNTSNNSTLSQPRISRGHSRCLLVLFLITLYTTFGLRSPSIPEQPSLPATAAPRAQPHVLRSTHTDSRMPMARRATTTKALVYRKKELWAYYQQKAFHPLDVGFYVNCAALVGVALWALVERRHYQQHAPRS